MFPFVQEKREMYGCVPIGQCLEGTQGIVKGRNSESGTEGGFYFKLYYLNFGKARTMLFFIK